MILNGGGMYVGDGSRIPVPIHVDEAEVEADLTPDFVEASVGLVVVLDQVAVGAVAEGGVGGVLAVAEFVVSALTDVEGDGTASGYSCVAGSVTAGIGQTQSAAAPGVHLALLEI
jgi:hypothetical protein